MFTHPINTERNGGWSYDDRIQPQESGREVSQICGEIAHVSIGEREDATPRCDSLPRQLRAGNRSARRRSQSDAFRRMPRSYQRIRDALHRAVNYKTVEVSLGRGGTGSETFGRNSHRSSA